MWDEMGLPRETKVPGQSLDYNQKPAFLENIDLREYLTLEAIYWRGGFLDRELGLGDHPVIEYIEEDYRRERPQNEEEKTQIFNRRVEMQSLWYQLARQEQMLDHTIIAFEATRTKRFEDVNWPNKHKLKQAVIDQSNRDPKIARSGQTTAVSLLLGSGLSPEDQEAIFGRPYYEITMGLIEQDDLEFIDRSVQFITETITSEALRAMKALHVRPFHYWTSQTELMMAAARPTRESGPWTRQDIPPMVEFIAGPDGKPTTFPGTNLRHYSNMVRNLYEPGYQREHIVEEDQNLITLMEISNPRLGEILENHTTTSDDRELIKRLVRLARFGYGNAVAKRNLLERIRKQQFSEEERP